MPQEQKLTKLGETLRKSYEDKSGEYYDKVLAAIRAIAPQAIELGDRGVGVTESMKSVPRNFHAVIVRRLRDEEAIELKNYTGDQKEPADDWTASW